jgi:hypothetical protein
MPAFGSRRGLAMAFLRRHWRRTNGLIRRPLNLDAIGGPKTRGRRARTPTRSNSRLRLHLPLRPPVKPEIAEATGVGYASALR